jgi:hypothetical protein
MEALRQSVDEVELPQRPAKKAVRKATARRRSPAKKATPESRGDR